MPQPRRLMHRLGLAIVLAVSLSGAPGQAPAQVPPAATSAAPAPALSVAERAFIIDFLRTAPDHGLRTSPVDATDEQALMRALFAQAAALRGDKVHPAAIDFRWALPSRPLDIGAEFPRARSEGRLSAWLSNLAPADSDYSALVAARRRYAEIAADGGWPPIAAGAALKLEVVDPRVVELRRRLASEGYVAPSQGDATRFDVGLRAALQAFQRRHGLPDDGVVGDATLASLNTQAASRLATIDANLERARWAPQAGEPRVEVDVAAAELVFYQPQAQPLSMRVIVGDPQHQTPLFASRIEAVVFNPPWVVPTSIAAKELWPKEARHPGYLARNGFSVVGGQLRQAPGPRSALGYVKFDITSPFGVYLHDTPSRGLFARDRRALSHGCIRVQLPRDMAALFLAEQGWTRQQVEDAIATGKTRRVPLRRTVPVVLSYRTAVANTDGTVTFRTDVYGWDAKLIGALALQGVSTP